MKRKPPQKELSFPNEPFALVSQKAIDGDRVAGELAQSEADRAEAESHQPSLTEIFGEPIFAYTRAQAIEDGVLVDLMQPELAPLVREAGFKYPIAMTIGAWSKCIGDPDKWQICQDLHGRLWDVLHMLKHAIALRPTLLNNDPRQSGDRVHFQVMVYNGRPCGRTHDLVRLWCLCGPGDDAAPVFTIMLEGED